MKVYIARACQITIVMGRVWSGSLDEVIRSQISTTEARKNSGRVRAIQLFDRSASARLILLDPI